MPTSAYDRIGEVLMPFLAGEARRADAERLRQKEIDDRVRIEIEKERRIQANLLGAEERARIRELENIGRSEEFAKEMQGRRQTQEQAAIAARSSGDIVEQLLRTNAAQQATDFSEEELDEALQKIYPKVKNVLENPELVGTLRKRESMVDVPDLRLDELHLNTSELAKQKQRREHVANIRRGMEEKIDIAINQFEKGKRMTKSDRDRLRQRLYSILLSYEVGAISADDIASSRQ